MDPDGRYIETIWDVVSISIGVKNLRENIKSGNVKAAIGDGVGILIDGLAAAFPVVPGGIGAARTAGKAAINAAEGAIDAAKAVDTTKDAGKAVKNPFGSKGKPDHQNKVEELAGDATKELGPEETMVLGKKIRVEGSNRRPDVQILDKDKKTRKIFEAERKPYSKRNRLREEEYDKLGIEHETHPLN